MNVHTMYVVVQLTIDNLVHVIYYRKIAALETRLSEVTQKEIEWNATIDKV